jgi:fructosamine-3-kinase
MEEDIRSEIELWTRQILWNQRWGAYVSKRRVDYCAQCLTVRKCKRAQINPYIRMLLFLGEDCPDIKSIWKAVIGGE